MCLDIGVCALHTVSLEARRSCRRPDKRASDLVGRRVVVGGLNALSSDLLTPSIALGFVLVPRGATVLACSDASPFCSGERCGSGERARCVVQFCVVIAGQLF